MFGVQCQVIDSNMKVFFSASRTVFIFVVIITAVMVFCKFLDAKEWLQVVVGPVIGYYIGRKEHQETPLANK